MFQLPILQSPELALAFLQDSKQRPTQTYNMHTVFVPCLTVLFQPFQDCVGCGQGRALLLPFLPNFFVLPHERYAPTILTQYDVRTFHPLLANDVRT